MSSNDQPAPSTKALNERFFRYFQHEVTGPPPPYSPSSPSNAASALQDQMLKLPTIPTIGGERSDAIDHCLAGIARLSAEVKDASVYIPPYDQRTYGEAIKALSEKLQNTRNSFAPRSKFSFSSGVKKNPSAISLEDAEELAAQRLRVPGYSSGGSSVESSRIGTPLHLLSPANEPADNESANTTSSSPHEDPINAELRSESDNGIVRHPSFSKSSRISLSNHSGLHIILPRAASHATSSGTLSRLTHCVVDMATPTTSGRPFTALTLRDITNSLIICGAVAGPVHITSVHNSVIVVSARQFRMHDSESIDVYLHCASRPIIEDCQGIRFAPLPESYVTDNTTRVKNMWDQVDDFKWLKAEASPHWSVLPEEERVGENVWREVVPGGPGKGVEQILRAVKGD